MQDGEEEIEEYVYKILVVGDLSCGKTSFIHRYVNDVFSKTYRATIGVDFALKTIRWDNKTSIRLQLWDIAGQERFGHMTRVYYKEARAAFIVYDVTRERTFKAVTKWKLDIDENLNVDGVSIPVVLLANKCDLADKHINKEELDEFCKTNGFIGWFQTSAKENINIDAAGKFLVDNILRHDPKTKMVEPEEGVLNLGSNRTLAPPAKARGCNC